jgi:hypothetical protein
MMHMTYQSMMEFAESWIAAWNRRDVEAVLAHYAEEAQFVSPVARNLVGRPTLRDKKELEASTPALDERRRHGSGGGPGVFLRLMSGGENERLYPASVHSLAM